jgi:hypothetical protein
MHAFVVKQILTRKISPCAHTRLQIWTQYIRLLDTQRKTREVHNACEPSSWADLRIALAVGDSLPRMRGQDAKMDVGDSLAGLLPGRTHELSSREIRAPIIRLDLRRVAVGKFYGPDLLVPLEASE